MKRILLLLAVLMLAIIGIIIHSLHNSPPITNSKNNAVLKQAYLKKALSRKTVAYTGPGQGWFVRPDGGTVYSADMPLGQCDGKADAPYPGTGVNQHCAVKEFKFLWDDRSGLVGLGKWLIAGGDTVVIRGCTADPTETNISNPDCRMGWGGPTGPTSGNWCYGVGSYTCSNPDIPAGTAAQPTRIISGCAYDNDCNPTNSNDPQDYVANLAQVYGGYSLSYTFNLQNTQHVLIQGIELTTHNGKCTVAGNPSFPRTCSNNQPLDDYAQNGFITNSNSLDITFIDIYAHGFNSSGFYGSIGGPITMTRVKSNFNAFAGWNFDNGTPNAAGSSITASYVTMVGNGCYEEYPIKHAFPCQAAYDDVNGGFGDAWSGQDSMLDFFICDHCLVRNNTKDGFMGPHTQIAKLTITNSIFGSNGGEQLKWGTSINATTTFLNNTVVGDCLRLYSPMPGSPYTYGYQMISPTPNPGAYLSDQCRAAGDALSFSTQPGSSVLFANNTVVGYNQTILDLNCGVTGGVSCPDVKWFFENNIFLGYILNGAQAPGLYYLAPGTNIKLTTNNNVEFGIRNGDVCGTNGNQCVDPLLTNEPIQQSWTTYTFLDNFNFVPTPASPALLKGVSYVGMLTTDALGNAQSVPPVVGAVVAAGTVIPPTQTAPTITWATPSNVTSGTKLSATQLNATASTPGTFVYIPANNTAMYTVGMTTLSTTFTPTDKVHFTTAKSSVPLTVVTGGVVPPPPASFTCTKPLVFTLTPTSSGTYTTSSSGCK